jgi:hypothetical protein
MMMTGFRHLPISCYEFFDIVSFTMTSSSSLEIISHDSRSADVRRFASSSPLLFLFARKPAVTMADELSLRDQLAACQRALRAAEECFQNEVAARQNERRAAEERLLDIEMMWQDDLRAAEERLQAIKKERQEEERQRVAVEQELRAAYELERRERLHAIEKERQEEEQQRLAWEQHLQAVKELKRAMEMARQDDERRRVAAEQKLPALTRKQRKRGKKRRTAKQSLGTATQKPLGAEERVETLQANSHHGPTIDSN